MRPRHLILAIILLLYVVLGLLYAVKTPDWQAPDEPAHYNYVRFVAANGGFPELKMGDYPHGYLEQIKSRKFPPELSIDPIRYEFHQPPLYYVLLAPIFNLGGGALLPLRIVSVLLGLGVVAFTYTTARRIYPRQAGIALGAAAFVAFLPQHLATVSQVGNDVLAELLFAAVLYILVGWVMETDEMGRGRARTGAGRPDPYLRSHLLWRAVPVSASSRILLGIVLGLILVTKTTAYIAVPLAGGVLAWRWWRERASVRRIALDLVAVAGPAALIAFPWYARDLAIYGWPDFLGLIRHDQIVVGQTRTGEYLAQVGWGAYTRRAIEFTFKSFWGVFGWLGVFMDSRVYFMAALLSIVALGGIVVRSAYSVFGASKALSTRSTQYAARNTQHAIRLLALSAFLTLLTYVWYNTQFVQHQGRYLFTALIPLGIAFAAGWDAALGPRTGRILAGILIGLAALLGAWGILSHTGLPKWPMLMAGVLAGGLFGASWLPRGIAPLLAVTPYGLMILIDLYALFKAIVPQLAR
jgi:4-amino-4-deoxy-L-arabinose transferase-like glycosyltransferase